jgi:hypothetical protein
MLQSMTTTYDLTLKLNVPADMNLGTLSALLADIRNAAIEIMDYLPEYDRCKLILPELEQA